MYELAVKYKIPHLQILSRDTLSNLSVGNYIINLNKSDESGSHWVALIKDADTTWYYDPLGNPALPEIQERPLVYSLDQIQNESSVLCGIYALDFLRFFSNNQITFDGFQHYLNQFSFDTLTNDANLRFKYCIK